MKPPWSLELPEGPGETIPSRGRTWTCSNTFQAQRSSSPVRLDLLLLSVPIGRQSRQTQFAQSNELIQNHTITTTFFCQLLSLATRAQGPHPFPFRTRALRPAAPMVLRPRGRGRVGRRRHPFHQRGGIRKDAASFFAASQLNARPQRQLNPRPATRLEAARIPLCV